MRDKQTFLMKGSFALLLFVILGYMVKFYPETLVGFDQSIQTAIRGDLPDYLTILFRSLTRLIDIPVIITWVVIIAFVFYRKRWKIESFFMLGNLALAGLLIVTFKNIYQRPRPAILHLVEEKGFSFPSGHSLAVTLMVGTLIVILSQRIKDQVWRKIVQIVLGLYLVSVLVSRVYLGVHYPSDVLASLCVGLGVLFIEFPFMTSSASNGDLKANRSEYRIPLRERNESQYSRSSSDSTIFIRKEVARYSDALPVGRNNPSRSNQYSCLWRLFADYRWASQGLSGFIGRSGYDFC